jgi:exodeoxyribonuclease VII large subunit
MPSKTQWDFGGELFKPSELRRVVSVSDLTARVKRTVEDQYGSLWVRGEVSNLRVQSSGHAYFVLKDAGAQLNCVLFRGQGGADRGALRDGAQVVLGGDLTVYEPRGTYQLRVSAVELQGVGALQAAFERLKARLAAEGLFDAARKRPIPAFPIRVALVTSPTGAALRDVLHGIGRRYAGLDLILAPCRVQGDGAGAEIAAAIERLNRWSAAGGHLDVILATRGGGSLEDLWCFNEEIVARAIAASAVPVISAVGHEIDFTIADLTADLRAATPTAAAEILTQHYVTGREWVTEAVERLQAAAGRGLSDRQAVVESISRRLVRLRPRRRIETRSQALDDLSEQMRRSIDRSLRNRAAQLGSLAQRLAGIRLRHQVARRRELLDRLKVRLQYAAATRHEIHRVRLDQLADQLRLLSPQSVLDRGYSMTFAADNGALIRDAAAVQTGQRLVTRLKSGEVSSVATRVSPSAPPP